MKKIMLILMVLLFILNCAPNVTYITHTGQVSPFPSYYLSSTNMNLHVNFHYALSKGIKDIDGTIIQEVKYLNLFDIHDIVLKNKQTISLTIEVYNPENIKYQLQEKAFYSNRKNVKINTSGNLAHSQMKYRKYTFELPVTHRIRNMNYSVMLLDEKGNIICICGPFSYNVIM